MKSAQQPDPDFLLDCVHQGDASARQQLLSRHRARLRQMVALRGEGLSEQALIARSRRAAIVCAARNTEPTTQTAAPLAGQALALGSSRRPRAEKADQWLWAATRHRRTRLHPVLAGLQGTVAPLPDSGWGRPGGCRGRLPPAGPCQEVAGQHLKGVGRREIVIVRLRIGKGAIALIAEQGEAVCVGVEGHQVGVAIPREVGGDGAHGLQLANNGGAVRPRVGVEQSLAGPVALLCWPAAGIGNRLRTHPAEVSRLSLFRQSLEQVLQAVRFRMEPASRRSPRTPSVGPCIRRWCLGKGSTPEPIRSTWTYM